MVDRRRLFVMRDWASEVAVVVIAVGAGLLAATARAEPTGSPGVDGILVTIGVVAVVWASASASWWTLALATGTGASIALDPVVAVAGLAGFLLALQVGLRQRNVRELGALVGAIATNVLIRSELDGFFGLSAAVGVAMCILVLFSGLRRRPAPPGRIGRVVAAVTAGVAVLAIVGAAAAIVGARSDLTTSSRLARQGMDAFDQGDYARSADLLEAAGQGFERADSSLGGVLAAPSRWIPALSQHVHAASSLASAASEALGETAAALRTVNAQDLSVSSGTIDLAAVRAVREPLVRVHDTIRRVGQTIEGADSPWLVRPVRDELTEIRIRLGESERRVSTAVDAVRLAPTMLGDTEPRRYLLLFTSPSEARGGGGFVGNYAEVVVDDGAVSVSRFGRRSELEAYVRQNGARCRTCPEELLDRYGRFGLNSAGSGVGDRAWSNITMPAHFPYVAAAAADLYPQSGGRPIDGVLMVDPYVMEALLAYTGPVDVPEYGVTIQPEDAADFVLLDQYLLAADEAGRVDNSNRVDAVGSLAERVIASLLAGTIPAPADLADDLGPLVDERRLTMWSADPVERDLLERVGLLGSLPPLGEDGGFSVSLTNAGGSKIDVFLDRRVAVRAGPGVDGVRRMTAEIELTNGAPSSGLPDYVIGNSVGLPAGYSRLFVTFYGPPNLVDATLDGEPLALEPSREAGWWAFSHYLTIGPGGSARYRLEFDLPGSDAHGPPVVFEQPLAARD